MESLGKIIVALGVIIVGVGLLLWGVADKLSWLGHLPGDIKVERPGFRFYAPVTTMLLLSVVLSVVMWLIGKWFR